ncbi:hypothetical protein BZG36_01355 [Bifiguratus adelaidae]|uniref:W2 domain-containing protein n=1 Tax=Bifiguratus adelaidae TaxID=1938954 RepID=A0A261Y3F4_9FUNG|nr:hypothetical protein BZG36_01355 [Bifiguratus adelaidae]
MATVNIRRDVKDSFYRYKMPVLRGKVEGQGNGIKTVVVNMSDVARSLSRPPGYPTKFFGCELGAQTKMDEKNDRYIVNGAHDENKLRELLDSFIKKFVLCPSCSNPETDIIITKNDEILLDCKACGQRNPADMRHKLVTYILKNPPTNAKKGGKKGKKNGTSSAGEEGQNGDGEVDDEDDDIISRRINKEAANMIIESKLENAGWSVDISEEAVARRMAELSVKTSLLGGDDDDDDFENADNKYDLFGTWLDENQGASDQEIIEKAEELGVLEKHKAVQVLVQCIFTDKIVQELPKRIKLLKRFVTSEKAQKSLLGGIERLVGLEYKDELLPKVSKILMILYEEEIVEEEVFLKWGEKPSKRYVDRDTSKIVEEVLRGDPVFDKSKRPFMSRSERVYNALEISKRLVELRDEKDWSIEDMRQALSLVDMHLPTTLHYGAFIAVILSQGTNEQIAKWIPLAERHAVIGCYAQTELGHGSNVAGLETLATYDPEKEEFVIHSPRLQSSKWWIGGLGVLATHAIVQAQLIIHQRPYGPHTFIVPIRSLKDHTPLKGVTVGDIGPKAYGGFNVMFHQHRIPRENMLMKFAQVSKDGKYTKPPHDKLSYGSMVTLRAGMVHEAASVLARATTIATRYTSVRRQFNSSAKDDNLETQVISYSSVQHRIVPLIALAYAFYVTAEEVMNTFEKMMDQLKNAQTDLLGDVHGLTCALKTYGSRRAAEGAEECRKAMGGHGYSAFSGISEMFASYIPSNTYEGDNFVLAQQTARYVLKELGKVQSGDGNLGPFSNYLANIDPSNMSHPVSLASEDAILDTQVQLELFGTRAARAAIELASLVQAGAKWTDLNIEAWNLNCAHAEFVILKVFSQRVEDMDKGTGSSGSKYSSLAGVLRKLRNLYVLNTIYSVSTASFLMTKAVHPDQLQAIGNQYRALLRQVSTMAVSLTDSFGFSDYYLNSALGSYSGAAYENLFEAAQRDPVNSDAWKKKAYKVCLMIIHLHDYLFNSPMSIQ